MGAAGDTRARQPAPSPPVSSCVALPGAVGAARLSTGRDGHPAGALVARSTLEVAPPADVRAVGHDPVASPPAVRAPHLLPRRDRGQRPSQRAPRPRGARLVGPLEEGADP